MSCNQNRQPTEYKRGIKSIVPLIHTAASSAANTAVLRLPEGTGRAKCLDMYFDQADPTVHISKITYGSQTFYPMDKADETTSFETGVPTFGQTREAVFDYGCGCGGGSAMNKGGSALAQYLRGIVLDESKDLVVEFTNSAASTPVLLGGLVIEVA